MSYYFTILSPKDVPLFSITFGTSKAGGDGVARFRFPESAAYMNQFIVHAALDIVEEAQWTNGSLYLKHIDTYPPAAAYVSAFLTPSGVRFLLLHQPPPNAAAGTASGSGSSSTSTSVNPFAGLASSMSGSGSASSPTSASPLARVASSSSSVATNPTSPQAEEAVRQFMNEVYENWVKTVMSPFYRQGMPVTSPVFRARVQAAARKWL
ncbi:hypothetical protein VTN31DRAFT_324 [Thermomyces dupontii]|uniref:uncharacterized protein n=1 Tax=Talaromyces thermophilus TaxID=28565 RepID=UPI0037424F45